MQEPAVPCRRWPSKPCYPKTSALENLRERMIEFQSPNPIRDLEDRLAPRRAAEARHHKGPPAHGRTDLLLRADRVLGPLLKLALRGTGLYGRGLRNALQL